MDYEQAATIALEAAQHDGLTRWVYRARPGGTEHEEWRVTIRFSEIARGAPLVRIVPQDRTIPPQPQKEAHDDRNRG